MQNFRWYMFLFLRQRTRTGNKNHEGCATMEAITLGRWDWYKDWKDKPWKKRGEAYENLKESISQKILDVVYEQVPQAKDAMDFYELSTPLSVRDMVHYPVGEMYGLDHTAERFRQKWLRPQTEIKKLISHGPRCDHCGSYQRPLLGIAYRFIHS